MAGFDIGLADGPGDLDAVRRLCRAYRSYLLDSGGPSRAVLERLYSADEYEHLLTRLDKVHKRPRGAILLARAGTGQPAGCGMLQPLPGDAVEMKRVFVDPAHRGARLGRALVQALSDQARADGYRYLRFDTARVLAPARALYAAMGFTERGPYSDLPDDIASHLCFYERDLGTAR